MLNIILLDNELVHYLVVGSEITHCIYLFHFCHTGTFDIFCYPTLGGVEPYHLVICFGCPLFYPFYAGLFYCPTHGGAKPYYYALYYMSFFWRGVSCFHITIIICCIIFSPGLVPVFVMLGWPPRAFAAGTINERVMPDF